MRKLAGTSIRKQNKNKKKMITQRQKDSDIREEIKRMDSRIMSDETHTCVICMPEKPTKLIKFAPCGHSNACKGCAIDSIDNQGKLKCMLCRVIVECCSHY